MHERTKFRLHSHDVPYGSGSGQQPLTGFPNVDDSYSYWVVKPVPKTSAKQGGVIKSGAIVCLQHMKTRKWLHSHLHASSILGNLEVINLHKTSAKQGGTLKSGAIVCLLHMKTRKWLHRHLHASPILGNMEVSCFGGENDFDTGDHWKQDPKVRLQHVDTRGYSHSHDKKFQRIAGGQPEVCGVKDKIRGNVWLAAEGVYLPTNDGKAESS